MATSMKGARIAVSAVCFLDLTSATACLADGALRLSVEQPDHGNGGEQRPPQEDPRFELPEADIASPEDRGADYVFNLASPPRPSTTAELWLETMRVGSLARRAARACEAKKAIFFQARRPRLRRPGCSNPQPKSTWQRQLDCPRAVYERRSGTRGDRQRVFTEARIDTRSCASSTTYGPHAAQRRRVVPGVRRQRCGAKT